MPISNSYPSGIPIEDADLFVGTKATNNRTVNYTAQGVADYLNINSKVAIGGQMSFQFTIVPNIPKTIAFEGGGGNNTAFSAITKLIVSAIDLSTANITIFLNYLNNSQVLLSQQNQPNFFGHYKITGYTQIGTSAFYELDLEFIGGNGAIIDKQYYDLVSFVLSTEAPLTEWGDITGDIEDQTDLIDYISSQITTPTLQVVTDEGNTTTNSIVITNINNDETIEISNQSIIISRTFDSESITLGSASISTQNSDNSLSATLEPQNLMFSKNGFNTFLKITDDLSNSRNYELPDASGTIALTTDIPTNTSDLTNDGGDGVNPFITAADIPSAVTSVGLTMPSAFSVTNSPITSTGDIAVTGAGLVSQYVRGDGTLANFPNSTGGGSSVNYYLNGSVSQGTFGGDTYYQMSKTPILGAGTNFTRTNGAGNGYIASFITDVGDPSQLNIPGGNWNIEFYFNASSGGGSPSFYAELYKVSATNVFTLIASDSLNPEGITNGTTVDQYFTSIPVPQTTLLVTDRLAVRIFVNTGGRTITLHTENGNLSEVLTTFTTGLTALNGLTDQVQFFDVGTGATNFNISSSGDTHTFNLLFNIRRNANNSTNNNINYNGYAVTGSAESSAVWTITRLTIAASGSITVATATNVAWTDRETTIYT
jgi:hypothetical protein